MTYQGTRARPADDESARVFEVSEIRLAADGRVSHVLWAEVDAPSDHDVSARVVAPVADVVDAIHAGARIAAVFAPPHSALPERFFVVARNEDGRETIGLDGEPSPGRDLADMARLDDDDDDAAARADVAPATTPRGRRKPMKTFAVSKVELDADGRVVAVRWGRVDTAKNAWATDETVAPVAAVVQALHAGGPVFALFPSTHGHVPERQFVVVDYDDGRQTIVLDGPATHEREIHDMDRLDTAMR
jgi:hypothetical protein